MNASKKKAVRWDLDEEVGLNQHPPSEEEHVEEAADDDDEKNETDDDPTLENETAASSTHASSSGGVMTIQHENDEWELTWPIYHMLPRQERKELAFRHGFSTIGDFEEYMTLQRALVAQQSGIPSMAAATAAAAASVLPTMTPYENDSIYARTTTTDENNHDKEESSSDSDQDDILDDTESKTDTITTTDHLDCNDEHDDDCAHENDDEEKCKTDTITTTTTDEENCDNNEEEDLIQYGGMIRWLLPEELFAYICEFLPIHHMATLAWVSPYWKIWTRQEHIYKRLCERYYLQQCHKSQLRPHKFQNSYRIMLEQRPRVKAGGGIYVLRCARVKPILRDMTTQIPKGAILETVYYRYIYFCERHHKCLYALSTSPPEIVLTRLHKVYLQVNNPKNYEEVLQQQQESRRSSSSRKKKQQHIVATPKATDDVVVWGAYKVHRDTVIVQAKQEWQMVQFRLQIHAKYDYYRNLYHSSGRFGVLTMIQHRSYPNNSVYSHLEANGNNTDNDSDQYNIDIENETRWHQPDVCNYPIVEEVFRFIPDARF